MPKRRWRSFSLAALPSSRLLFSLSLARVWTPGASPGTPAELTDQHASLQPFSHPCSPHTHTSTQQWCRRPCWQWWEGDGEGDHSLRVWERERETGELKHLWLISSFSSVLSPHVPLVIDPATPDASQPGQYMCVCVRVTETLSAECLTFNSAFIWRDGVTFAATCTSPVEWKA